MNEEHKKSILEKYKIALQKGERFWPDSIYKDLLVSFAIFIVLLLMATFIGVPGEPKADPNDTAYIPRPEWYFMFLFQMLKYFPGRVEWVGTAVIPGLAVLALLLLPLLDKNPRRHYSRRKFGLTVMGLVVTGIVGLTIVAFATTPPQAEVEVAGSLAEKMVLGQDLYSVQCVECHGAEGEGGEVKGVEGFEGVILDPLNSSDVMYTYTDESLANVIAYGQQVSAPAMPPFGKSYGGALSPSEIDYIATFMRYTWDDRAELPAEAALPGIPVLAAGEVPSYEIHIQPLVKRYCLSCHRAGKENNNYLMGTYEDMLNTGDNTPVMVAGDLNSITIQVLNGTEIPDPKTGDVMIHQMPPSKLLKPEYIDMLTRWIMAGMPNTAAEAQALMPTTVTPTP